MQSFPNQSEADTIRIRPAASQAELDAVRLLLREYAAHLNASVGGEHICVASYENELTALPGDYAPPSGALLAAWVGDQPAGCVALRALAPTDPRPGERACELKRLWVRPAYRGAGLGMRLAEAIVAHARESGYTAVYLDTVPKQMRAANRIYARVGFEVTKRYRAFTPSHPEEDEIEFFRLDIS